MVEQAAKDYAKLLQSTNPSREFDSIGITIEDMLTRLEEYEALITNIKGANNTIMSNHVSGIVSFNENFKAMRDRIDKLEKFVEMVNANVDEVEKSVDIAEKELNVTDYSLRGLLLKPLLAKAKSATATDSAGVDQPQSNLKDGEFQAVPIFNCDKFFGNTTSTVKTRGELNESK